MCGAPRSGVREPWLRDRWPRRTPRWPGGGLSGPPALSLVSPRLLTLLPLPWIGSGGLRATPARVPGGRTACLQCLLGAVVPLCHPPGPSVSPTGSLLRGRGFKEVLQVLGKRLVPDVVSARRGCGGFEVVLPGMGLLLGGVLCVSGQLRAAPEPAVRAGFAKPRLRQRSLSAGDVSSGHRPLGALDLMFFSSSFVPLSLLNNSSVEGVSGRSCASSIVCICLKHYAAGFAYCRSFKTFVRILFLALLQITAS